MMVKGEVYTAGLKMWAFSWAVLDQEGVWETYRFPCMYKVIFHRIVINILLWGGFSKFLR